VCVREGDRETKRERQRDRERGRERDLLPVRSNLRFPLHIGLVLAIEILHRVEATKHNHYVLH
jgi:hypothetical protein